MIKFRTLRADEVDARVGTCNDKGFSLLLYKDARCDQNILDETVGAEKWQRRHYDVKGNMFCSVGIFSDERKDWVWKDDCGTESNTEKEKGEASDSFKRACFNWGIGRELYTAPFIYIKGNVEQRGSKYVPSFRNFKVLVLEYQDGKISKLQISGDSEIIYEFGMRGNGNSSKVGDDDKKQQPKETGAKQEMTLDEAYGFKTRSGKPFNTLNMEQLDYIIEHGGAQSSTAARLVKEDRENNPDLQPLPEEDDLPF